jgi:hypothetical protein
MQFRFAALLFCAAALTPLAVTAQQSTKVLSPADSGVAVPAMKYESAFASYLPFRDEKLAPWRAVNDDAARVGGHLGIFGGAADHAGHSTTKPVVQQPATTPKPPPSAMPPMMHGGGHEGMKK